MNGDEKIIAAIDIGTNSFHLIVAKVLENGSFKVITRDKEVVRLGKSSSDMKYLTDDAIERGVSTIKRFKLICDSFKTQHIRAVATSATREALNKNIFIEKVSLETGIQIEVVSGFEEARLIYLGVLQALPVFNNKILLVDIGGGSTEFLVGEKGLVYYANSIKLGAVRLTEKFFRTKKLSDESMAEARLYVKSMINPVVREIKNQNYEMVIGSSGTIINLGMIIYAGTSNGDYTNFKFNNYSYDRNSLQKAVKAIIKSESLSELKSLKGLDADRTDIITAGALILEQIFSELNIDNITLSNYSLREGIILDTIDKEHKTLLSGDLSDVRYRSVINLADNCRYDKPHAEQVLRLSLKIFDFASKIFLLTEKDKEYLEAAALLHDIGHSISHSQHHRHSYYLIRNSELLGFNDEETEIIANLARYHRKSHPKIKHEGYVKLNEDNKIRVKKLAGILRIADGLDRGHNSCVKDINFEYNNENININVTTYDNIDASLEIWGANIRKELFEEVFGRKVFLKKV